MKKLIVILSLVVMVLAIASFVVSIKVHKRLQELDRIVGVTQTTLGIVLDTQRAIVERTKYPALAAKRR